MSDKKHQQLYVYIFLCILLVLSCLVCISCCKLDKETYNPILKEGLLVEYELKNTSDLVTDVSVNNAINNVITHMNTSLDAMKSDFGAIKTTIDGF
jgi:hypothetical protein